MLWLKTFHLLFVISWIACLFYWPRIFVNLAQIPQQNAASAEYSRLLGMAQRLGRFALILLFPATGTGILLWLWYGIGAGQTWLYAKLALVSLLAGYHHACSIYTRRFTHRSPQSVQRSERWFRLFNEIPVLLLFAVLALVVHKPSLPSLE